jgi:hypothetical protein
MIAIDRNWEHNERFVERSNDIKAELEEKLSDDDTLNDLTGKTSTAQAVKRRIELMDSILKAGAGLN